LIDENISVGSTSVATRMYAIAVVVSLILDSFYSTCCSTCVVLRVDALLPEASASLWVQTIRDVGYLIM
jgi:hypothetical protein